MQQMHTPTTPLSTPPASPSPRRLNVPGIVGLGTAVAAAAGFVLMVLMSTLATGANSRPDSPLMILLGLLVFAIIGADIVAIGLGIAGLFQADRGKVTAVLAIVLGAAVLAVTLLILVVGVVTR